MKLTNKLLLAFGLGFASNAFAENPIIQTYYSPDPAPVVFGDTVCVYTGNDEGGSFFTMHGWRVSCTTDMVNWTDMGELILKMHDGHFHLLLSFAETIVYIEHIDCGFLFQQR